MTQSIPLMKKTIEGALLAFDEPLSLTQLQQLFPEDGRPSKNDLKKLLRDMAEDYQDRAFALQEVATGFRFQIKPELSDAISTLTPEKPPRYSRAVLETLAIIAYRQPITRAEIESIRGVQVSSHVVKTLMEREWIKVVGHRDLPGKPALLGTTADFLNDLNVKNLSDLPPLKTLQDLGEKTQLDLLDEMTEVTEAEAPETQVQDAPSVENQEALAMQQNPSSLEEVVS